MIQFGPEREDWEKEVQKVVQKSLLNVTRSRKSTQKNMPAVNRYIDQDKVYSGLNSIVYKARSESSGEIVALKVIDEDLCMKPHNAKREANLLRRMLHANVLSLIDEYTYGDDRVLVTPFYQFDLSKLLQKNLKKRTRFNFADPTKNSASYTNMLPPERADEVFFKIAEALRYLHHDMGIIHRDIKPSNVFFTSETSDPILGDFGIAYDTRHPPADEPPQTKYTDISTGVFKAPELCFGISNYSFAVDIWSLGVLLTILYSNLGSSCLDDEGSTHDLILIHSQFANFGTPLILDSNDRKLYWPEVDTPESHFSKFEFKHQLRKPVEQLIPRCRSAVVKNLFDSMMVYESDWRSTARDIVERRSEYMAGQT